MPSNSAVNLNLTSLDFDSLQNTLRTWFTTQSVFKDYPYVDSNMSVLIDVLARNTYLNAFYLNQVYSEAFVDSAQLRDSMVSKAKEFNYLPQSTVSSTTSLNVTFQTANIQTFEIPKGAQFSGLNGNGTYQFVTDQNYVLSSSNGYYQFSNVNIYEGFYTTDIFSVDISQNNQIFTLTNQGIDISSLTIIVSEDSGSTNNYFKQANNLFGLNGNSEVYFIQPAANNKYAFQFGDGITGYIPQNGAIVYANYRVAQGNTADGIGSLSLVTNLGAFNSGSVNSYTITLESNTSGGAPIESLDSMRFNIPRHFETQERMVIDFDYQTLIEENFPAIKDCIVYGSGTSGNAVTWGIPFISAITQSGAPLTQAMRNDIISYVNNLKILGPLPQIIDPNIIYIDVYSNVHVDFTKTTLTPSDYKVAVANTIMSFNSNNLGTFETVFRTSQLMDAIDEIDDTILSNETSIKLTVYSNIAFNTSQAINFTFANPIQSNVQSVQFTYGSNNYYITDTIPGTNVNGVLYLTQLSPNNTIVAVSGIGNVNYTTGFVYLQNLLVSTVDNTGFSMTATPTRQDIYPLNNTILEIDTVNGLEILVANN